MKKLLLATVLAAAFATGSASAQSLTGLYAGVGGAWSQGTAKNASSTGAASVFAGYDFNPYLSAELDLATGFANGNQRAATTTVVNGIAGIPVTVAGRHFKPYGLVGTGYEFAYTEHTDNIHTTPIYNVGGGVMYDINDRLGLDVRYTYTDGYNDRKSSSNSVGASLSYKF